MLQRHYIAVLLVSTFVVELQTQYVDFFGDLQALLQPIQYHEPRQGITTKRPTTRKHGDRHTNNHNVNIGHGLGRNDKDKHDNFPLTSTHKPSRKTTRINSGQNKRPTTKNRSNEYLKITNNLFTTTPSYGNSNYNKNSNDYNGGTNTNFEKNNSRKFSSDTFNDNFDTNSQMTEKPHKAFNNDRSTSNYYKGRDVNNRNEGTNNKNPNSEVTNISFGNPGSNYDSNRTPNNNLGGKNNNLNIRVVNENRGTTNNYENAIYFFDNDNKVTTNPNRGTNNSKKLAIIQNNDRPNKTPNNTFITQSSLLNRPGVKPKQINAGNNNFGNNFNNFGTGNNNNNRPINSFTTQNPLLNKPGVRPGTVYENKPPITNRPVTQPSDFGFPRPTDSGAIVFTDQPDSGSEPDLEIGPDEDDMSAAEKRRYSEIIEEMCDTYKSLTVKKVVALPLLPSPQGQGVEFNVSNCKPINIPLIIGGKVSSIEEFPHMALVGWMKIQRNGYSWKCGGSLISDQYILTAGHCTYHEKDYNVISGPPHAVQLGSARLDDPGASVVKTSSVIRHPKYKVRRSYYDVALIKMASRVTFSAVIRPACIGVPPAVGQPIVATGWGRTEFGGDQSKELRSVSLPIWDMQDCKEIWGTSLKLPNGPSSDSQVCAGDKRGGKDTCQGDSGGPAQIQDGCAWRVVAVTSLGRSCGAPQSPALYATIPRAFVAAQVFGKHKINFGNKNQQSDHRNRDNIQFGTASDGGNQQINGVKNGDRNNNQQQQTGDRYNSQQQFGNIYDDRQPTGDRYINQAQNGDRYSHEQQNQNRYNNQNNRNGKEFGIGNFNNNEQNGWGGNNNFNNRQQEIYDYSLTERPWWWSR